MIQPRPRSGTHRDKPAAMRRPLLAILVSMLLGLLGLAVFFGLCLAIGMAGGGALGFQMFTVPGLALGPIFSFLTDLLPGSFVRALVGTSSVGSSLGLLALWSMLSWFVLFWAIAFVVLRRRALSRGRATRASTLS